MRRFKLTSLVCAILLGGGLVLGIFLGGLEVSRAQPEGEKAQAQEEAAAVPTKKPAKPEKLTAEAREKQRLAAQVKLAELSVPPVMQVHPPFIFVIKGRTLYQFDLQTLELLHWASLDPPEVLAKKALQEQKKAEDQTLQVK